MVLITFSVIIAIILGGTGSYLLQKSISDDRYKNANFFMPRVYLRQIQSNTWSFMALILEGSLTTDPTYIRNLSEQISALSARNGEVIRLYSEAESSGPAEDEAKAKMERARATFLADSQRAENWLAALTPKVKRNLKDIIQERLSTRLKFIRIA